MNMVLRLKKFYKHRPRTQGWENYDLTFIKIWKVFGFEEENSMDLDQNAALAKSLYKICHLSGPLPILFWIVMEQYLCKIASIS